MLASAFVLCSCENELVSSTPPTSDNYSSIVTPPISSKDDTPPKKDYGDLSLQIANTKKELTLLGDLKDEKYLESAKRLEDVLNNFKYDISLSVVSLDNQKALCYNTEAEIFGACTVKAAYTLYCLKQMEKGVGSLDTKIAYEKKHYEPGTGDMQYSAFGTVFTMDTIISKCMEISDNVAYLMMVDYFGRDGYNEFITDLGCPSLTIKPTVWSLKTKSNELITVWEEIYNYIENKGEYAKFLYDSCTNTTYNHITAGLEGVDYSHKSGHNSSGKWLSFSDSAIVWKEGAPYIITVLSDAPGPRDYQKQVFSEIIKIVNNELM